MASHWHYTQQGRKLGPISTAELRELATNGGLRPDDFVWREGMGEWAPASKIQGLFDGVTSPPPPRPPAHPKKELPSRIGEPQPSKMASIAKWVTIGWSLLCLLAVFSGLANVGSSSPRPIDEYEKAGAVLGVGCAMGFLFIMWAVVAVPSLVIWLLSRKA